MFTRGACLRAEQRVSPRLQEVRCICRRPPSPTPLTSMESAAPVPLAQPPYRQKIVLLAAQSTCHGFPVEKPRCAGHFTEGYDASRCEK
jgi:hypothetical protein